MEAHTPLVIGNWKMNGSVADVDRAGQYFADVETAHAQLVICPPAVMLARLHAHLAGSKILLGGQDCHLQDRGAFTGEISASMLVEAGASFVIVGHSERRLGRSELNEVVRAKISSAGRVGLRPILCIGEDAEQRRCGDALDFVTWQLRECLPSHLPEGLIVAYEPIWAIGSGMVPSLEDVEIMHSAIRRAFGQARASTEILVIYGGSVTAANAAGLLAIDGVDGVLVGGASLDPHSFHQIAQAADHAGATALTASGSAPRP